MPRIVRKREGSVNLEFGSMWAKAGHDLVNSEATNLGERSNAA